MLEEFENEALFLRLGLPSTLIRHENGAFRKRSSNWRNLKTPALRLRVDGKHFENGASRKRWRHDNHVISLTEFSWNTSKSEMTGHRCIFKFLWRSVDGKTWCVFRVKSPFSNSSGVVWTENIWCVFRVKSPFSNSSGVVLTENIWCVLRVKSPFSNECRRGYSYQYTLLLW